MHVLTHYFVNAGDLVLTTSTVRRCPSSSVNALYTILSWRRTKKIHCNISQLVEQAYIADAPEQPTIASASVPGRSAGGNLSRNAWNGVLDRRAGMQCHCGSVNRQTMQVHFATRGVYGLQDQGRIVGPARASLIRELLDMPSAGCFTTTMKGPEYVPRCIPIQP